MGLLGPPTTPRGNEDKARALFSLAIMSFYPPESGAMRPPSADRSASGSHEARQASEAEAGGMVAAGGPSLLSNIIQQCSRNPAQFQRHFWRHQMDLVENGLDTDGKPIDFYNLGSASNGNSSALPLARIKKVMKNDDEVKVRCGAWAMQAR